MADYLGLALILGFGLALLLIATWLDARSRRSEGPKGAATPQDTDRASALPRPKYLPQGFVDDLPNPAVSSPGSPAPQGTQFDFGHLHPAFATNNEVAAYDETNVLLAEGPITDFRILTNIFSARLSKTPLAILAPRFDAEVVATLVANRKVLKLPVVVAEVTGEQLSAVSELTKAEVLSLSDLQAGYAPEAVFGKVKSWLSNDHKTWLATD